MMRISDFIITEFFMFCFLCARGLKPLAVQRLRGSAMMLRSKQDVMNERYPGANHRIAVRRALPTLSMVPRFNSHEDFEVALKNLRGDPLEDSGNRVVVFRGSRSAKIMLVGEAPGAEENAVGKPFVGRSGRLLDSLLRMAKFDVEKDVYITNIVRRRPPNNRYPTADETEFYKTWLLEEIRLIDPIIIVTLGRLSMNVLLDEKRGISKVRGNWYSPLERKCEQREGASESAIITSTNAWCMPWFHPSYLLRNPSKAEGEPIWLTCLDALEVRKKYESLMTEMESN